MAKVFSVSSVQLQILKSNPVQILVVAHGMAATSGWKNIDLVPVANSDGDGVLDLDFVGTPPTGISLQVLTPVTGDFVIDKNADKLAGVMVHARTNSMTALVGGGDATTPGEPSKGVDRFMPTAFNAMPDRITTFALGEEGITTLALQFAESPPLTPHIEKMAMRMAETAAMIPSESWVPNPAEKLPFGPGEKFMMETNPVTDFMHNQKFAASGENGPGPDPIGPMFFSPFGVR
ncbi:MAG: hypothetical protein HY834_12410 [Devosia nanyangense]|uniref:Uncharacterized protein n=1 Tax=Devosia nanyangense TaxID=1228055 RepID=A0A933L235_9HYPH|nr:hypothetical protein [Devosia nanyangense]